MVFTVVDIETTGLSKHCHRITEIAAAKLRNGRIRETFHTIVNPQVKIPSFITSLTGISNEMVRNAPIVRQVLPSFVEFLGTDVFVAHNATFDFGFLSQSLERSCGLTLKNNRLCTRKLANRLLPGLPRKRLPDLCACFGVANKQAHRAMGDTIATAEVFSRMLDMLEERGIYLTADIIRFERSPTKKENKRADACSDASPAMETETMHKEGSDEAKLNGFRPTGRKTAFHD